MAINPLIIDALKKLNPTLPAGPDELIDREWEGMARGWDVMERIEVLLAAEHTVRGVLHGPIGVGKTTELQRWARGLAGVAKVLVVSVGRPKQPMKTAEDVYGLLKDSIWAALQFDDEDSAMMARSESLAEFGPIKRMLEWSEFYAEFKRYRAGLLLIDGLDLLPNDQAALFGAARNLPLDELPSVVFVASHPWCTLTPREQRDSRLDYIWELPCFAVQSPMGTLNKPAIDALAAGLRKRLADAESAFWDLDRCCQEAAYYSGGVPRDAIRILHSAVLSAAKSGNVNAANLALGVNELRQDLAQSLSSGELQKVALVGRSMNHEGDVSLISKNAILPYDLPERRYWLPHPTLKNLIGAPQGVILDSLDVVALRIQSGLPVVLQRVPRRLDAQAVARGLIERVGRAAAVVTDAFTGRSEAVRVIDGRSLRAETFRQWDEDRAQLGDERSPLVVLLDVNSTKALLANAPHLSSWAGGVQLPEEKDVRPARSDDELALGRAALRRILQVRSELRQTHSRVPIGVVLGSDQLFLGEGGVYPLQAAREELDEGIVYITRLCEEVGLG